MTELLQFLRLMNYFAIFIFELVNRARPLYEILQGSGFSKNKRDTICRIRNWAEKWGDLQRVALRDLKGELSSSEILAPPDPRKRKIVITDVSDYGTGGVLIQVDDDGGYGPFAFISRKIKSAEVRYSVTKKECLAIVHSMKKWTHCLHDWETFTVMSDHEALKWLISLRDPRERLARWMIEIRDYDFEAGYVPGKLMKVPDTLSHDAVEVIKCPKCQARECFVSMSPR